MCIFGGRDAHFQKLGKELVTLFFVVVHTSLANIFLETLNKHRISQQMLATDGHHLCLFIIKLQLIIRLNSE